MGALVLSFYGRRIRSGETPANPLGWKSCVPRGIRTPVSDVKSRGPGPLDDGDELGTRASRGP